MAEEARTARLFRNGRSQSVRIPREFEFASATVFVRRRGEEIVLSVRPKDWVALTGSAPASSEYMRGVLDEWAD